MCDAAHNVVAIGFGTRECDSWAIAERVLNKKLKARVGFEKSVMAVVGWSCGRLILVDEPAEEFASVDPERRRTGSGGRVFLWRME